jgi:hypothetical protein
MSTKHYKLKPRVALESDGQAAEGVLVDTYSATLCACNATAWTLLQELKRGASAEDLIGRLSGRYTVTAIEARRDVHEFLRRLDLLGLVDETA